MEDAVDIGGSATMKGPTSWHLFENSAAVAEEAAGRVLAAAQRAIAERGVFRIVLAGGRTPRDMHLLLARADTDWTRWHVYFGDERCLPVHDGERNSEAARVVMLEQAAIPTENFHPIPAELGAEVAAAAYTPIVAAALPFDLVTLGVGEDGHTASLFPGHVYPVDDLVHAVHHAPKPPPDRVSLSARALSQAREILILATGGAKRDAVAAWRAGHALPVASVGGDTAVDVLLDREACGDLG